MCIMATSRRDVLIGLTVAVPIASALLPTALQAQTASPMLKVSRVIVGRDDLSPALADRVHDALAAQISGFEQKLTTLVAALGEGQDRDAALSGLDEDNLDLALKIAQPWYTGVAGVGDEHGFDDGAIFVTYLGAEALRAIQDSAPFRTYSTGAPGWWVEPAPGVTPPPMPAEILDWTYVPPGASGIAATADPRFVALVTPKDI